jgi:hypothetical protein
MDLESLVRPFESPAPLGTRRITPVRTEVPTETAGGTWGVAGQLPVAVEVPPGEDPQLLSFDTKKRKEHREVSRDTERVRVENPDEPNQYVVIERLKSVRFREKKPDTIAAFNPSGSFTLATPGASPIGTWQPGETQVRTDGTGPMQPGESRQTYPLTVEDRDYFLNWPPGPNDHPA